MQKKTYRIPWAIKLKSILLHRGRDPHGDFERPFFFRILYLGQKRVIVFKVTREDKERESSRKRRKTDEAAEWSTQDVVAKGTLFWPLERGWSEGGFRARMWRQFEHPLNSLFFDVQTTHIHFCNLPVLCAYTRAPIRNKMAAHYVYSLKICQ